MDISVIRNTKNLHGFSVELAMQMGIICAVVYNGLAAESLDYAEVIHAGMGKNLQNKVIVESGILWVRYETAKLLEKMFPYFTIQATQTALATLEQHKLIRLRLDNGSGFTWIMVSAEYEEDEST